MNSAPFYEDTRLLHGNSDLNLSPAAPQVRLRAHLPQHAMDTLSILSSLVSAANYLYTASEKMKENREECRRLCKDVNTIVDLITQECKNGMPSILKTRLTKLER